MGLRGGKLYKRRATRKWARRGCAPVWARLGAAGFLTSPGPAGTSRRQRVAEVRPQGITQFCCHRLTRAAEGALLRVVAGSQAS